MEVTFALGGSVLGTFATMIRAFGFYVVETLLPAQALDWYMTPSTSFADGAVVLWLFVHAALLASAAFARKRAPRWTLAVVWFYVFLLPVSNWPFFTGIPTAERFLYVPLFGVALALGCGLVRAASVGRPAFAAALVAAAALGGMSITRAALWRDDHAMRRGVLADHESPRFRGLAGKFAQDQALALRAEAFAMPAGPRLDDAVRRVKALLEEALDDSHRAIDQVLAFEMTSRSRGLVAMQAEYVASNVCYMLNRPEEALFHAEEALRINDTRLAEPHYDRAFPLLKLGFAPQAMESMRRARSLGWVEPRPDIGSFFIEAGTACERDGLFDEAEGGYTIAVDASPEGALRDEARQKLAALKARGRAPGEAEVERVKLAALEERLAAYPRSCPVRRDHSIRK
jgi:tetratricopeptide (TPR) repeat protein